MKFVKTVYKHEYGQQRTLGLGVLQFNHSGICAIDNNELAEKVVNSSKSLVFADEDEEAVQSLLKSLEAADAENNKPVDQNEVGKFLESADNGAAVESTNFEKKGPQTIGVPADQEENNGEFTPSAEAAKLTEEKPSVIGAPAEEPAKLVDAQGNEITTEKKSVAPAAPVADAPKEEAVSTVEESSEEVKTHEYTGDDAAVAEQLRAFDVKDIKEMMAASETDPSKYEAVEDKEELIKIAVDSKII